MDEKRRYITQSAPLLLPGLLVIWAWLSLLSFPSNPLTRVTRAPSSSSSLSPFFPPHGLPLLSCWRIIMYIVSGQQTCSTAAAAALAIERRPAKPSNNRTRTLYRNRRLWCISFFFYDGHVWVDEAWFSQVLSVRRNSSPCQQEKWYRIRELHHQSAIAIVMGPNYDISLARRPLYASGTRFFRESRENERKLWSVRELLSRRRFDRLFFFFPLRSPGLLFQCKHNKKIESYQYMDTKKEKKRKELMLKSPDRAWAEPPKTVEQFIELRTVWWWWWWPAPSSNRSCRFVSSSIFYAGLSI